MFRALPPNQRRWRRYAGRASSRSSRAAPAKTLSQPSPAASTGSCASASDPNCPGPRAGWAHSANQKKECGPSVSR